MVQDPEGQGHQVHASKRDRDSTIDTLIPLGVVPQSLDDVQRSQMAITRHLYYLAQVAQDIRRARDHGASPVYLVDYSELHSLIFPVETDAGDVVTVSAALESSSRPMVLPPGALYELLSDLDRLGKYLGHVSTDVQAVYQEALNTRAVKDFIRAVEHSEDQEKVCRTYIKALREAPYLQPLLPMMDQAGLGRYGFPNALVALARFLPHRFVVLEELVGASVSWDEVAYREAYTALSYQRYYKPQNNKVDALNLAVAVKLNRDKYRDGHFFVLLTHSLTVLRALAGITWRDDPLHRLTEPPVGGLLREPRAALYWSHLELLYPSLDERAQFVAAARGFCEAALRRVQSIVNAGERALDSAPLRLEDELPGWQRDRLPEVQEFVRRLNEVDARATDIRDRKAYFTQRLRERSMQGFYESLLTDPEFADEIEFQLADFLRGIENTKAYVRGVVGGEAAMRTWEMASKEVTAEKGEKGGISATYRRNNTVQRGELRLRKTNDSQAVLCAVDLYDTFFAVSIRTRRRLEDFLDAAHVTFADVFGEDASNPFRRIAKVCRGLDVVLSEPWRHLRFAMEDLPSPLTIDWIFSEFISRGTGRLELLRISTPLVDLWFRSPRGQEDTGEAGLLSHLLLLDVVPVFACRMSENIELGQKLVAGLERRRKQYRLRD